MWTLSPPSPSVSAPMPGGVLGSPKAAVSRRTIPVPQLIVNALKQWKLACPKGELELLFPNEMGRIESHGNAIPRAWQALQLFYERVGHQGRRPSPYSWRIRYDSRIKNLISRFGRCALQMLTSFAG